MYSTMVWVLLDSKVLHGDRAVSPARPTRQEPMLSVLLAIQHDHDGVGLALDQDRQHDGVGPARETARSSRQHDGVGLARYSTIVGCLCLNPKAKNRGVLRYEWLCHIGRVGVGY